MEETIPRKKSWFISATGTGLSATVGGISVIGIAAAVGYILSFFGVSVSDESLAEIILQVVTVLGAVYTFFGLIRKVFYKFK